MPDVNLPPPVTVPPVQPVAADLDRMLHNWQSRYTGGRSPSTLALAFMDWAAHVANQPFQTATLSRTAFSQWQRLATAMLGGPPAILPKSGDHRFNAPGWRTAPFSLMTQSVLLGEDGGTSWSTARAASACQINASSPSRSANGWT